ncbi:hypothetical protein DFH28DRAFT_931062 [Melampsora americana]|nr:hypothetical protein DFH28DRAFT_931062 [Melampsora americana]
MCMDSSNTILTNYARFQMGLPGKKECPQRCALFIGANGFDTPTWDGVKQKIDNLETKFRDAQKWTKQTGEGGGLVIKQDTKFEIEVLRLTEKWTEEQEQELRTMAAQTTKAQPQETLSTNLSGWEPTQRLEIDHVISDDSQTGQDNTLTLTKMQVIQIYLDRTHPRWNFIQPVKKPISKNPRRSSAGTLGVLKLFQASLPTQADFNQLKSNNLAATKTN